MKISNLNNNNIKQPIFSAKVDNSYEQFKNVQKEIKYGMKSKADKKVIEASLKKLSELETAVKDKVVEKPIPKIFTQVVKWFGKINVDKTGNKALDTASRLTKIVLWGNVGKEAVGTTLYTVQALTNPDLPQDKRKFVGMYDLSVGVVSTAFSFIFGVGLEKAIKNGYKGILKPLSDSKNPAVRSKAGAAIVGLAAFSSFFLQTIIGKRIVAPALGVPAAGKLRKWMEDKEAAKKANEGKMSPFPSEALVLAKAPDNKPKLNQKG